MWGELKSIWNGLKELLEIPRQETQTRFQWVVSQLIIVALMIIIVLFNFKEFCWSWRMNKNIMFRECIVCKDGYDTTNLTYSLSNDFCPQCVKEITPAGINLVERFRDWGMKQVDKNGRSIGYNDVKGITLSAFLAIKNKAPREPLFDALVKYTWDNISDTVTLSELLEELSTLQENKLKPLKGNTDVHLERPEEPQD